MYTEKELAAVAKRENNNKRKYLVVNRYQAKHIPVSPSKSLEMFGALADQLKGKYDGENLLLVGFAETATAIGAALAVELNTCYMQTTRENIDGVEYLYFLEEHSHSTDQKIVKTDLDRIIDEIDRIIFVEDEVTTGNTILNIIKIIEKTYSKKLRFSIASLLNGMDQDAAKLYEDRDIPMHYLVKTSHDGYTRIADGFKGDGTYWGPDGQDRGLKVEETAVSGCVNARRLTDGTVYLSACEHLYRELETRLNIGTDQDILVLGTEEFMYPAIFTAKKLEEKGNRVKTHSTTRSPIAVSSEEEYPLHTRYELASLYDSQRRTFLYDIGTYDHVIILTDSVNEGSQGINTLVNAIYSCGSHKISLVRWC
ncbi:hypothetical protein GPL15_05470 [Clostridium sp. MCC353]|uniref:phosphoribosyltransferase domain-containing protein n=1 Tax=Clostridium sp. MCC353 TaxID=2592646 RepID=UPI001C009FDD|nr:phosphoribosyltransferase domain-containing protein [Clostridium sp. MCC353]MBT9775951.1 hypothetical protein [Clostridium sp. MCC353]